MEKISWIEEPPDGIPKMCINPCSLATDISAHARRITVRPYRNSDITTVLRTYFVPDDTPFIPFPTCFTDPDHLQDRDIFEGAGWVGNERYYNYKSKPLPVRLTPFGMCQKHPDIWEFGGVYGVDEPLPCILNYPICCLPGNLVYAEPDVELGCSAYHTDQVIPAHVGLGIVAIEHEDEVIHFTTEAIDVAVAIEHIDNVILTESSEIDVVVTIEHVDNVILTESSEIDAGVTIEHEDEVIPGEPATIVYCGIELPTTIYATLNSSGACSCAPSAFTVTLTYDIGSDSYIGTAPFGSCGNTVAVMMYCVDGYWGNQRMSLTFSDSCDTGVDGGINVFNPGSTSPTWTYYNFWNMDVHSGCCPGVFGFASFQAHVTPDP